MMPKIVRNSFGTYAICLENKTYSPNARNKTATANPKMVIMSGNEFFLIMSVISASFKPWSTVNPLTAVNI
jgi:hypothetical protein